MTRKKLRESVFTLLFRMDFYAADKWEEQIQLYLEDIPDASEEEIRFIKNSFVNITEKIEEIDAMIEKDAEGWKLKRIPKADLTIMRLAVYEIYYDDKVPAKVAINEAVELAKKFGGEKSSGFINAILAKINRNSENASENAEDLEAAENPGPDKEDE